MTSSTLLAALLALSFAAQGCTVAGAEVGARSPRYEEHPTTGSLTWTHELRPGEEIGIRRRQHGRVDYVAATPGWEAGVYGGLEEGTLLLEEGGATVRVPLADIDAVRLKKGSHWVTGALVGALVDAMVVGLVIGAVRGNASVNLEPSHVGASP